MRILNIIFLCTLFVGLSIGCAKKSDSFSDATNTPLETNEPHPRVLYVASGSCYAGGVATSPGVFTIAAFNIETGQLKRVVIDYNSFSPGDAPVSIVEYDSERLLVLIENAAGRRLDLVRKDGSQVSTYLVNSTALSGILRRMSKLPDNSLLISKSTAIEKFSSAKSRVTQGVNPYVNAPASTCGASATLISSVVPLSNGKILYTHAAATPNNKIGLISANGYAAPADCLASSAAPSTTSMPTAAIVHSSGKLLVSYASVTTASNFVYGYDLDANANLISGATLSFSDVSVVNGPSGMTEDPVTGDVLVANGNSAFNTIERFTFDSATKLLTRKAGPSFIAPQIYTRCVTDMKVLSE